MKLSSILFLITLQFNLSAQNSKFIKYNGNNDSLEIINKTKLDSILSKSEADLNFVAIFTNGCLGTRYMLKILNKYSLDHKNKLNIILANSDPYSGISTLKKLLNKYSIKLAKTYVIDSETYKDKRSDSRVKGYKFRNDICTECKSEIIGVPYYMLFAKGGKLIYHGYASLDSLLRNSLNH